MNQDKEHRHSELRMIPLNRIEILNPRERNSRVFEQIVGNIEDEYDLDQSHDNIRRDAGGDSGENAEDDRVGDDAAQRPDLLLRQLLALENGPEVADHRRPLFGRMEEMPLVEHRFQMIEQAE